MDDDAALRLAAFDFLAEQGARHGDLISRSVASEWFIFGGERVPLIGPGGDL